MMYGNAAWGLRELSIEEQLKITAKMGLKLLELGIANAPKDLPADANTNQTQKVKELYDKYNIELICAATGNDFSTGSDDDVAKVKKVIDICSGLGVKYLRIFAGFSPADEVTGKYWDIMIGCLKSVCEYAKEHNVVVAIETHGGVVGFEDGVEHFESVTTNVDLVLKILNEVQELMLVYDPANLYAVGVTEQEMFFDKVKNRICYVHLKDFVKLDTGHLRPAACGEGTFDWKKIIGILEKLDVPAMFEYEVPENVESGLMNCYEYIKKIG